MKEAITFLVLLIVGVIFALSLGGCATGSIYRGSGEVAPTPQGHADLCAKQLDMPGCPK